MKHFTFSRFLFILTLFSCFAGVSQEKHVIRLLNSYISETNKLVDSPDTSSILSLFHKKYQNNTAYIGLSGVLNRTTINYTQFAEQLEENLKNKNYNFSMSLGEIVHEVQKENSGVASALINFESKIEGKVAEKGTILMNIVATKDLGEWKITHNNTVRISEEREIGNCVCYLFSKGESYYNAETYYPAGLKYEREYKSYRIGSKDGKRAIINRGNKDRAFIWNENGDILENGRKIGSAQNSSDAVQVVLAYVYSKTCTEINFS